MIPSRPWLPGDPCAIASSRRARRVRAVVLEVLDDGIAVAYHDPATQEWGCAVVPEAWVREGGER